MTSHPAKLKTIIERAKESIDMAGYEEISQYFEYREHAMAFEGLVIELLALGKLPPGLEYEELDTLAKEYGLNEEGGVFDFYMYEKLVSAFGEER